MEEEGGEEEGRGRGESPPDAAAVEPGRRKEQRGERRSERSEQCVGLWDWRGRFGVLPEGSFLDPSRQGDR